MSPSNSGRMELCQVIAFIPLEGSPGSTIVRQPGQPRRLPFILPGPAPPTPPPTPPKANDKLCKYCYNKIVETEDWTALLWPARRVGHRNFHKD